MEETIGCNDISVIRGELAAIKFTYNPAGFSDDKCCGCGIPGVQVKFPESV